MLEPDYYFDGRACYLSCDVGSADDCGYTWQNPNEIPFDIYADICGVYKGWSSGSIL